MAVIKDTAANTERMCSVGNPYTLLVGYSLVQPQQESGWKFVENQNYIFHMTQFNKPSVLIRKAYRNLTPNILGTYILWCEMMHSLLLTHCKYYLYNRKTWYLTHDNYFISLNWYFPKQTWRWSFQSIHILIFLKFTFLTCLIFLSLICSLKEIWGGFWEYVLSQRMRKQNRWGNRTAKQNKITTAATLSLLLLFLFLLLLLPSP